MHAIRAISLFVVLALIAGCGKTDVVRLAPLDDEGGGDGDTDADADTDSDVDTEVLCDKGTYEGDVVVHHAGELAVLVGYTSIAGDLFVLHCDSCVHLGELICLTSVEGSLLIETSDNLTSLFGLSSLTTIGETLDIRLNDTLTNLDGLSSLTSVDDVIVLFNESLTNVDGLGAIETLSGLSITLNYNLTSVNLTNLTSVGSHLVISNDHALNNLDGFSSLTSVGGILWVFDNASMHDCEVCELIDQLTEGPGDVYTSPNVEDDCTPVPDNCP